MLFILIDIIIHLLDLIVLVCICQKIIMKKVNISIISVLLGIVYSTIFGVASCYLNLYLYKIVVTITIFYIIRYLTKKKLHDLLIIYVTYYLLVAFVQFLVLLLIKNVSLIQSYRFLLAQILITSITLLLIKKIPLDKLFHLIERELILKLIMYTAISVLLIALGYLNFDYNNTEPYIIPFFILILVSFLGIYQTIKYISYYTNKMPLQLHDVKNVLMGLYISTGSTSDTEKIRSDIQTALKILEMDSITPDITLGKPRENILAFVNQKKRKAETDPIITSELHYYEDHCNVPLSAVIYMLGVLLDNAIESGTRKEILIHLSVAEESLLLSVANEYEKKSDDDFERMFEPRYSTKSAPGNGYGLPHLSHIITDYGGEIELKYDYFKKQNCNYLTLIISIDNKI